MADSKNPENQGAAAGKSGAAVLTFPESPRRKRRRLLLGGVAGVVVIILAVMALALFTPALALKDVRVIGSKVVPEATIQTALEPLKGTPLPRVSEDEVSEALTAIVQLKSWNIRYEPPHTMVLTVVERAAVALLKEQGKYSLIDAEGTVLARGQDPAKTKLPIIDAGQKALSEDVYHAMTAVLGSLPSKVLSQMASASASSVDSVTLKLNDGKSVVWGNASNMELKARVLEALLKAPANPQTPVKVYDVSAPNRPVTR